MKRSYYFILAGLVLLALVVSVQYCKDKKEVKQATGKVLYTEKEQQAGVKKYEVDRVEADSLFFLLQQERAKKDTVYLEARAKDRKKEAEYRAAPSIEKADTVILYKNETIALLEQNEAGYKMQIANREKALFDCDAERQRSYLAFEQQTANANEVAAKLEKQVNKKWNVSVAAGAFVGPDLKPRPGVGLTLGRTLFRF